MNNRSPPRASNTSSLFASHEQLEAFRPCGAVERFAGHAVNATWIPLPGALVLGRR